MGRLGLKTGECSVTLIEQLISAVKRGTATDDAILWSDLVETIFGHDADRWPEFFGAIDGDLTDAVSLLEHTLPGASWTAGRDNVAHAEVSFIVITKQSFNGSTGMSLKKASATGPTPACALLLATLMIMAEVKQ
jgi:hypothetical protein